MFLPVLSFKVLFSLDSSSILASQDSLPVQIFQGAGLKYGEVFWVSL